VIGQTLLVSPPLSGYGASHVEPPSHTPWPGGARRTFSRGQVVALGKLRRRGDSVCRFVVRLTDGAEVLVIGTDQPEPDRAWLGALGDLVPLALTSRQVPWTIAWTPLRVRCPIAGTDFRRELFSGNPPHAPHAYGWVVRLGGSSTLEQRAWLRAHGYRASGKKWCRADRTDSHESRVQRDASSAILLVLQEFYRRAFLACPSHKAGGMVTAKTTVETLTEEMIREEHAWRSEFGSTDEVVDCYRARNGDERARQRICDAINARNRAKP